MRAPGRSSRAQVIHRQREEASSAFLEITSGATSSDTVVTGDSRYFRVPLQWGQRFSYLFTPAGNPQPVISPGAYVSVEVFNPVRQQVDMTKYDNGGEFWFNSTRPPNSLTASTVYPARYTNRSVFGSRDYSLDGDYYLRLSIPGAATGRGP